MRLFSFFFILLITPAVVFGNNPLMTSTTVEMTLDNLDGGGSPSPGYQSATNILIGSFGSPACITMMSGNNYSLIAGYFGQDLIAPSNVTAMWGVPGGLARSITLQWTAPGDNEREDALLWGSRFHISTTTILANAISATYWNDKRDIPDIIISTANVSPQSTCSRVITGLLSNTSYYFRIWTLDQANNWSDLSLSGTAFAQPVILSVYVLDTSTVDFGWQQTAISTVASYGTIVRNSGNVWENYSLSVSTGVSSSGGYPWISSNTAATNTFVIYSVFNSTRPESVNFGTNWGDDILSRYDIAANNVNFSIGNISGVNIAPQMANSLLSDNTLWFKLDTPLSVATTDQQKITVTITASDAAP